MIFMYVLTTTILLVFCQCPKIVIMRGCDMIFRNVTFTSRIEIFKLWLELFFCPPYHVFDRETVTFGSFVFFEVLLKIRYVLKNW